MGIFCLAFAWLLMMTIVILFVKLNSIYDNLMPMCESGGTDNEGHKQNSHKLNSGIENKENDSNTTPLLCDKALGALAPYEHLTLKPRTDFYHWLLGPPPTRHQMLFWMDRLGVHVIMYIIQGILLNTAMFLSVFFAQFLVPAFGSKSPFPSFFLILAVFLYVLLSFVSSFLPPLSLFLSCFLSCCQTIMQDDEASRMFNSRARSCCMVHDA